MAARLAIQSAASQGNVLVCRGVHKRFGPTTALAGVDLILREGQVLAVTGESGSGKSTLMLCMSGILSVDSGEILYRGRRLTTMREPELTDLRLTDFGFVFQTGHLVPDMPAVANVAFPLMLRGARRKRAEVEGRAWLHRFGVGELADRLPGDMSVGQSQRVAVARALAIGPKVIFADEPTGSLDSRNGALVIDMLMRAAREQGSAIVLVTHSEKVARVADTRVTMRDGVIANSGR
jgi:putative ABC transport system ATP-binding protein